MKWTYSLGGGDDEPIIKDVPVYDAALISNGMYLKLGTTGWATGNDAGYGFVNACSSTVATSLGAPLGLGISTQTITTAGNGAFYSLNAPQSVATSLNGTTTANAGAGLRSTNSYAFAKCIINPLAVYRTLVSQNTLGTADTSPIVAAGSSGSIQMVITGYGTTSSLLGHWVYFCGTAGPNFGSLRKIVSNASAATFVLDYACTNSITSADKVVIFPEPNLNPNFLSTYAVATNSANQLGTCVSSSVVSMSAGTGTTVLGFRVVENYVEGGAYTGGITQLRYNVQGQYTPSYNGTTPLVNKLSTMQFYQDLVAMNHIYNAASTAY